MARPRILVTRPIVDDALSRLRGSCEVTVGPADRDLALAELFGIVALSLAGSFAPGLTSLPTM